MRRGWLGALALLAGCPADEGPAGVGYVRIAASDGPCTATQPLQGVPAFCPQTNLRCSVDQMNDLPFTRAQATVAFQGGSRWDGGNLIAMAWQNEDSSIGKLQLDIGPNRGYGLSHFPYPSPVVLASGGSYGGREAPPEGVQEAIGYVEWDQGQRRFAATSVTSGITNYGALFTTTSTSPDKNELYLHVAFDGVGPTGLAKCRVVGVHVKRDYARFNAYDPTWLQPDPTILLGDDRVWPPSFSGDVAPTTNLVGVADAPADPGGPAPDLPINMAPTAYTQGFFYIPPGGRAGDGAG